MPAGTPFSQRSRRGALAGLTKYGFKRIIESIQTAEMNPYAEMGRVLIENLNLYGLGVQPKSDIEALLFHCICNAIENQ